MEHGSERYKVFGDSPEITKLPNSRYRITLRCDVSNKTEDWYYSNREALWREFGDLYSTELPIDGADKGWEPIDGEAYPDMCIISQEWKYLQGKSDGPVVEFIYETLTSTWTNEDDDKVANGGNGLRTLTRTQVALPDTALPYDEDDVGVATITSGGKTLYLAGFEDTGGAQRGSVVLRWSEAGILNVRPIRDGAFSLAQTYIYTSIGQSPSDIHAVSSLSKPGGGTLIADATFFEPQVTNFDGFRQYNQLVIDKALPASGDPVVKIHESDEFFDVVEPGVMSLDSTSSGNTDAATVQVFPRATSTPKRYRKKATVEVFLTTSSSISETEVAFTEENTTWANIAFINGYIQFPSNSAESSGRWREFSQYLIDPALSNPTVLEAQTAGVYFTFSRAELEGDTTYTQSGVYRVFLKEYEKGPDGTQYFLKTVITF